jgi:hypothetical protein
MNVNELVKKHSHDGLSDQSLANVLTEAREAYYRRPTAPMLEIGSFRGGTAGAILDMLDRETRHGDGAHEPPLLITVDPYGGKAYRGGDVTITLLYGDDVYQAHKRRLAEYANHAHFLMEGVEWLARCVGTPYWRSCRRRTMAGFSFAFVDGEHESDAVLAELDLLLPHMAQDGRVLVDNVDKDARLQLALTEARAWDGWRCGEIGGEPGARMAMLIRQG